MYAQIKELERDLKNSEATELRRKYTEKAAEARKIKVESDKIEDQALKKRKEAIRALSVLINELE